MQRMAKAAADFRRWQPEDLDFLPLPQYIVIMNCTHYFQHVRLRPDRRNIKTEWTERAVAQPDAERVQADGRIRRWKSIPEAGGRWLRVVLLEDGVSVHNAFFDRRFRE